MLKHWRAGQDESGHCREVLALRARAGLLSLQPDRHRGIRIADAAQGSVVIGHEQQLFAVEHDRNTVRSLFVGAGTGHRAKGDKALVARLSFQLDGPIGEDGIRRFYSPFVASVVIVIMEQ